MNRRRAILAGVVLLVLSVGSVVGTAFVVRQLADADRLVTTCLLVPTHEQSQSEWGIHVPEHWPERPQGRAEVSNGVMRLMYLGAARRHWFSVKRVDIGWPFKVASWGVSREHVSERRQFAKYDQDSPPVFTTFASHGGVLTERGWAPDRVIWSGLLGSIAVHVALWMILWIAWSAGRLRMRTSDAGAFVWTTARLLVGGVLLTVLTAWSVRVFEAFDGVQMSLASHAGYAPPGSRPVGAPASWGEPTTFKTSRGCGSSRVEWSWDPIPLGGIPIVGPLFNRPPIGAFCETRRYGLPFHALALHEASTGETRGVWTLPFDLTEVHADLPRTLPVEPVWSGLIGNTVVYALGLWIVAPLPWDYRRWRRRRRGQCLGCGYDIGDLDQCPECGRDASPAPVRMSV